MRAAHPVYHVPPFRPRPGSLSFREAIELAAKLGLPPTRPRPWSTLVPGQAPCDAVMPPPPLPTPVVESPWRVVQLRSQPPKPRLPDRLPEELVLSVGSIWPGSRLRRERYMTMPRSSEMRRTGTRMPTAMMVACGGTPLLPPRQGSEGRTTVAVALGRLVPVAGGTMVVVKPNPDMAMDGAREEVRMSWRL